MPYIPHVTLGVFTGQPALLDEALDEAKQLDLDYGSAVNRLRLVKVNDQRTAVVWSREFSLTDFHMRNDRA
jgi:hypothetical protein